MMLFKMIQNSGGKVLLNRKSRSGTAVLGTYDIHGQCDMAEISDQDLRELAVYILENIPEPSPIKNARFVSATSKPFDTREVFSKINGTWYDTRGTVFTEEEILQNHTDIEVIR